MEGWVKVVFASDCLYEAWDEDKELPICPNCYTDYADCPCPGPTQDGYEYEYFNGVLYARKIFENWVVLLLFLGSASVTFDLLKRWNMKHILRVTETNNSKGKFLYEVVNVETGAVVASRHSNRVYVAATRTGGNFYGRVDLAQKDVAKNIGYLYTGPYAGTYTQEEITRSLDFWNDIAYIK